MTEAKCLVRDPLTPWTAEPLKIPAGDSIKLIRICHPSYPDLINDFFCFRALDLATEETPIYANAEGNDPPSSDDDIKAYNRAAGVHHGTVALACFIVAGNRPGILSPTRIPSPEELDRLVADSRNNVETRYNSLLKEELYYYYTNDYFTTRMYDVVIDFQAWEYPTAELLSQCDPFSIWKTSHDESKLLPSEPLLVSDLSWYTKARDGGCRLTGTVDACNAAHLIPEMHQEWWHRQAMRRYCRGTKTGADPTLVPENLISLRKDVHFVFDEAGYCFTVKNGIFVAHFLRFEFPDTLKLLHNRPLRAPKSIPLQYLLARFAWSVIKSIDGEFAMFRVKQRIKRKKAKHAEGPGESSRAGSKKTASGKASEKEPCRKGVIPKKRKSAAAKINDEDMKVNFEGDEAEEYRRLGEFIGRDMPKGFFDLRKDRSKFKLNVVQEDIVDRVIYYPGCEKAYKLAKDYTETHPEVRAVSNPEGPWMEVTEDESDI
ncbi:hypothetical protein ABW21_db0205329 [Orbilia brochopaga]|nr:hypothetical protein ABW21_db0205329 [Drechslerella brochopaga]